MISNSELTGTELNLRLQRAESAIGNVIASEIMQVISNLMLNAMDARPGAIAPVLHLRVHCYQLGIHLTVADNGAGIPAHIEEGLFSAHVTRKSSGTGLGLWLSKGLITKHGGRLCYRTCRAPGKSGTIFRVWFPYADAARGVQALLRR